MKKSIIRACCLALFAARGALAADPVADTRNVSSFVKLTIAYQDGGDVAEAVCGGALISDDLVLTASHCIPDEWVKDENRAVSFALGEKFQTEASLHSGASWVKFDPQVDLAILRMNRPATAESGAAVAVLDKPCVDGTGVHYPLRAVFYQLMNDAGDELPPKNYQTTSGPILRYGKSVLANGFAYISPAMGRPGDSGSPVFSADGVLIGIYNGTEESDDHGALDYSAALCVYRSRIDAESGRLRASP